MADLYAGDAFPRYSRPPAVPGLMPMRPARAKGAHRGARKPIGVQLVLMVLALAVAAGFALAVASSPGSHASTVPMRVRALQWAETKAGDWYSYGSAGPSTFDCSGLVMEAWLRGAGLRLPRTTYEMAADLSQLRVIPVADARRGDLVFFGTGHVELKTRAANGSFGALETGTRIGWHRWSAYWHPTFAMALR